MCLGSDVDGEESGNESEDEVEASVVALQSLYSVFLPPHLRQEARMQEKRCEISNRPSVYTGDSRTTHWRKETARRNAAKGCASLDTFLVRQVCNLQPVSVQKVLSPNRSASVALR